MDEALAILWLGVELRLGAVRRIQP
jgi:hypothetical protein